MLDKEPHFSPWDVLSLGTFCPLGRFVRGTFCPLGRFVRGTFCPLGRFVPWDVLYVQCASVPVMMYSQITIKYKTGLKKGKDKRQNRLNSNWGYKRLLCYAV